MERVIRRLLRRHGVELSRRLGQHLLVDEPTLERIAEAAAIEPTHSVVEVGAGAGNLTAILAQKAARVTAIELDERFRSIHEEVFGRWKPFGDRLEFFYGDALAFDYHAAARQATERGERLAIVGNIPYSITSPLVSRIIFEETPFYSMTLLMQREVAERLATGSGGRRAGAISIKVHFYCHVRPLFVVPRRLFLPPPQVESQLIQFRRREPPLPPNERKRFFALVEAAFAQRRKQLPNAVAARGIGYSRQAIEQALSALGLPATVRAEQLGLNEFLALYAQLHPGVSPK